MSKENVKKFYDALKTDMTLAEELQNGVNAVILQFAAKQNLAFTGEELAAFEAATSTLSDEELAQLNAAGVGAGEPVRLRECTCHTRNS